MADRKLRSFTLLEMLIALGIVIFLAGLTLTVGTALLERTEIQKTTTTLALLETALQEWEHAADRKLSWGNTGRYDIQCDDAYSLVLTELLETIRRQPEAKSILAGIEPSLVFTYEDGEYPDWLPPSSYPKPGEEPLTGKITILDAWGTPIYATHPGRLFSDPPIDLCEFEIDASPDADGTIRTLNEQAFGVVARDRRVCFVSAGPDGLFGILEDDGTAPEYGTFPAGPELDDLTARDRLDNIYSYPAEIPG